MYNDIRKKLDSIKNKNLYRSLIPYKNQNSLIISSKNKSYLNFGSNNYLNLAESAELKEASILATEKYGTGSSASRLITGTSELMFQLEEKLAEFKNKESALVFNSGYTANLAIIQTLNFNVPLFLVDKLVHASVLDGLGFCNATFKRFKHNDINHLKTLIEKVNPKQTIWIIVDSIYSMDGDIADINELISLKKMYKNVYLYFDEAHSTGVFGNTGKGLTESYSENIDIIMGTFSKSLGSFGAFVVCSKLLKNLIINISRPFMYTTALPPSVLASNLKSLEMIEENPSWGDTLLKKSSILINEISSLSYNTIGTRSQIIPLVVGDNERAINLVSHLKENSILAVAIRTPTVPVNSARVRLTITRTMKNSHIDQLLETLKRYSTSALIC